VDGDFVPLVVIKSHSRRLDLYLQAPISEIHRQSDTAIIQRQVEVILAIACK
jgi:hypothetical protein